MMPFGEFAAGCVRKVELLDLALNAEKFFSLLGLRVLVIETNQRPGADGIVDGGAPIGREETKTVQILQQPQKNTDDRVLNDVVCAGAHVDFGLVDQEHGVPAPGAHQGVPEILLHFRWTDSELRALQLVQWPVVLFGKHLSGDRKSTRLNSSH